MNMIAYEKLVKGMGILAIALPIITCASCSPAEDASNATQPQRGSNTEVLARETLDLLVAEYYTAVFGRIDTAMRDAVPVTQLRAVWSSVLADIGVFRAVHSETMTRSGGVETVTFVCDFESGSANVEVSINQDRQTVGLFVRPG